jgi:SnoaL-like domain
MNRSLGAVVASMLIGLTLPVFGQQDGPENTQQLAEALQAVQEVGRQYVAAYNRQDAAAIASLFAEDGVRITPYGIIQGREAIRSHFENAFKAGRELPGDWGRQAATAACGSGSLAGWNLCPKPEPSAPL